jgi:hypothetical protein
MKPNFLVLYVEDCNPKVREFKDKGRAIDFAAEMNSDETPDNWTDCIIEGRILMTFDTWYGKPKNKGG